MQERSYKQGRIHLPGEPLVRAVVIEALGLKLYNTAAKPEANIIYLVRRGCGLKPNLGVE